MLKVLRNLARDSRGVTGVETAVVALSFLRVASILGVTVVSLGQATSSETEELVAQHITDTLPVMKLDGPLLGFRSGDGGVTPFHVGTIKMLVVTYSATPLRLNRDSIVVSYYDQVQVVTDIPWSARWIRGDGYMDMLNPSELAELSVDLSGLDPKLVQSTHFTLDFNLAQGVVTRIKSRTPDGLDQITVLPY